MKHSRTPSPTGKRLLMGEYLKMDPLQQQQARTIEDHWTAYEQWRAQYYADQADYEEDQRGDFR